MIKAIFFDFDGVLTTDPNGKTAIFRNLSEKLPDVDIDTIAKCYIPWNDDNKCGKVQWKDIHNEYCVSLGADVPFADMEFAWKTIHRNDQMFDLVVSLKQAGYTTGIITSNSAERIQLLTQAHRLDDMFDYIVASADVGSKKDKKEIFEYTLEIVELIPEECVFIDNHEGNLVVPTRMGFKTYFHDDKKNDMPALLAQLQEWGVSA